VASVLQQLVDNDAVLLMYLADELPAEDRAEVERMLVVDAALRDALERLREAYGWFDHAVARSDLSSRPAVSEAAAVRRVGRAMRQWHARRLAAAPAPRSGDSALRYPWWAYPLAAAASVVIAFLVWWGNTDRPTLVQREPIPQATSPDDYPFIADPMMSANYRDELFVGSLGGGEWGSDAFGPGLYGQVGFGQSGAGEWDDGGSLYAAIDPSDANVLMLLNNNNAPDENDGAPDDDPIYQ
jgi:hypothetical protein